MPEQILEFEAGFNRQGNIYTDDTQNIDSSNHVKRILGHETNRMYHEAYSVIHRGEWDSDSSLAYPQCEKIRNGRINKGLTSGTEGIFDPNSAGFYTVTSRDLTAYDEVNPLLHSGCE